MAGTVTTTEVTHLLVKKITFAWTTTTDGAASATTTAYFTGDVVGAVQIPGSAGDQPDASYDVAVNDAAGIDVLFGLGANLSNSATTFKAAKDGLGAVVSSQLSLAVTNAGSANTGQTVLFIRS